MRVFRVLTVLTALAFLLSLLRGRVMPSPGNDASDRVCAEGVVIFTHHNAHTNTTHVWFRATTGDGALTEHTYGANERTSSPLTVAYHPNDPSKACQRHPHPHPPDRTDPISMVTLALFGLLVVFATLAALVHF